jgi:hypothetical protein
MRPGAPAGVESPGGRARPAGRGGRSTASRSRRASRLLSAARAGRAAQRAARRRHDGEPADQGGAGRTADRAGDGQDVARDAGVRAARTAAAHGRRAVRRARLRRRGRDARRRALRRLAIVAALVFVFVNLMVVLPMVALADARADAEALQAALSSSSEQADAIGPACPGTVADMVERTEIPEVALAAYCSAAGRWGVDWALLAGVGKQECDHGRSPLAGCNPRGTINHKGARGPMQFLGSTWRSSAGQYALDVAGPPIPEGEEGRGYATDADGDQIADPWTWEDATHAAARMLAHNGVAHDVRGALRAYNSKATYADDVLAHASGYRSAVADLLAAGPPLGSTARFPDEAGMTPQLRRLIDVLVPLFGRGLGMGCAGEREGYSEHENGRACDIMMAPLGEMPDDQYLAHGWRMVEWLIANAVEYEVYYVIWQEQIWTNGRGWRPYTRYPDGDLTDKHYDHVHISVY